METLLTGHLGIKCHSKISRYLFSFALVNGGDWRALEVYANTLCSAWDTHKSASQVPELSDWQTGWLEAHHCVP